MKKWFAILGSMFLVLVLLFAGVIIFNRPAEGAGAAWQEAERVDAEARERSRLAAERRAQESQQQAEMPEWQRDCPDAVPSVMGEDDVRFGPRGALTEDSKTFVVQSLRAVMDLPLLGRDLCFQKREQTKLVYVFRFLESDRSNLERDWRSNIRSKTFSPAMDCVSAAAGTAAGGCALLATALDEFRQ